MLVCAGSIAGPIASPASAASQSLFECFCLPTPEMYLNSVTNYFSINKFQNLDVIYASMC